MSKYMRPRSRGPLIYACIVSVLCVMTSAVSTFAWFQSIAAAEPSVGTGDTVTVHVSKPDSDFTAEVWRYDPEDSGTAKNYIPGSVESASWSDFKNTHGTTLSTKTLYAGYSVTYCVRTSPTSTPRSLLIDGVDHTYSKDNTHPRLNTDRIGIAGNNIDICEAIRIYGYGVAITGDTAPDAASITAFLQKEHDGGADGSLYSYTRAHAENISDTGIQASPSGDQRLYYFLTIHFSNDESTWYMPLEELGGGRAYVTPAVNPTTETTYWAPYTSGPTAGYSSLVYSTLKFKMNGLTLE